MIRSPFRTLNHQQHPFSPHNTKMLSALFPGRNFLLFLKYTSAGMLCTGKMKKMPWLFFTRPLFYWILHSEREVGFILYPCQARERSFSLDFYTAFNLRAKGSPSVFLLECEHSLVLTVIVCILSAGSSKSLWLTSCSATPVTGTLFCPGTLFCSCVQGDLVS